MKVIMALIVILQLVSTLGSTAVAGKDFVMEWNIIGDKVRVDILGSTRGWVGVGWSKYGPHAVMDSIVFWIEDGQTVRIDSWVNSVVQPRFDTVQDWVLIDSQESNQGTRAILERQLNTGDSANDLVIQDEPLMLIWASGAYDGVVGQGYEYHGQKAGAVDFNWFGGDVRFVKNDPNEEVATIYVTVISVLVGVIGIGHTLKKLWKRRMFGDLLDDNGVEYQEILHGKTQEEAFYQREVSRTLQGTMSIEDNNGNQSWKGQNGETEIELTELSIGTSLGEKLVPTEKAAKSEISTVINAVWASRVPYSQTRIKDVLLFGSLLFIQIGFLYIWNSSSWSLGPSLGYLAVANSLLVAIPATRNSVLTVFLGVPFEKTIQLHRWIGRSIPILVIGHLLVYLDVWKSFEVTEQALRVRENQYGIAAGVCLGFIFFSSLDYIRRAHFQVFYLSHFAFIAFYILAYSHTYAMGPYALAAVVFYGLDRVIRLLWGSIPRTTTLVQTLSPDLIKVRWDKLTHTSYSLGQYTFVNFPQVSLTEWHPFTLASGPKEPEDEVVIKVNGNFTKKLYHKAEKSSNTIWIRIDGPYGHWPFNILRYKKLVLVCGGVGVTPCMAALRHIYSYDKLHSFSGTGDLRIVYFVWACKDEALTLCFKDELADIVSKASHPFFPRLIVRILS